MILIENGLSAYITRIILYDNIAIQAIYLVLFIINNNTVAYVHESGNTEGQIGDSCEHVILYLYNII